ncbi:MAG: hypothetical protein ACFB51_14945 [Anaerolineae bacterium]
MVTLGEGGVLTTRVLTGEDTLSGGEALPGFSVPVGAIFGE